MTFRFQTAFCLQAVCVNRSNGLVTRLLETARNIKLFRQLGHPFVEDIRLFKQLRHLYYGISLNLLSNDMHGRRVTLFVQKNSLVGVVI